MPISHVLMLALVVIPIVLGLIFFSVSAFKKTNAAAGEAKKQEAPIKNATDKLKKAWK